MPGRVQKATALKIHEGNPGKRPLPEDEPKPENKAPKCPHDISTSAQSVWKRLAPTLVGLGLLTEVDGDKFAQLCQTRSTLATINRQLRKKSEPMFFITKRVDKLGNETEERKLNPLINQQIKYIDLFRKLAADFGLSPRDRAGLAVGTDKKSNDGEDLLS